MKKGLGTWVWCQTWCLGWFHIDLSIPPGSIPKWGPQLGSTKKVSHNMWEQFPPVYIYIYIYFTMMVLEQPSFPLGCGSFSHNIPMQLFRPPYILQRSKCMGFESSDLMWTIWKAKNDSIFKALPLSPLKVILSAKRMIRIRSPSKMASSIMGCMRPLAARFGKFCRREVVWHGNFLEWKLNSLGWCCCLCFILFDEVLKKTKI